MHNKVLPRPIDLDLVVMDLREGKGEERGLYFIEVADKDGIRKVFKVRKTKSTSVLEFGSLVGRIGDFMMMSHRSGRSELRGQKLILEEWYP